MTDQLTTSKSAGPARGYSWPAFAAGHTKSLKHGATSPRTFGPIADEIEAELLRVSPWLGVPSFGPTLRRLAVIEAQCVVLREYLDEHGLLDDQGAPLPAVALLERMESRATSLNREVGMTPNGWAQLTRRMETSPDGKIETLEDLAATGRRMLDATIVEPEPEATGSPAPGAVDSPEAVKPTDTPDDAPAAAAPFDGLDLY